jgi:hypothetical protein
VAFETELNMELLRTLIMCFFDIYTSLQKP